MRSENEVRAKLSEIESKMEELTKVLESTDDIAKVAPFITELLDLMTIRRVLKWFLGENLDITNRKEWTKDVDEWFKKRKEAENG